MLDAFPDVKSLVSVTNFNLSQLGFGSRTRKAVTQLMMSSQEARRVLFEALYTTLPLTSIPLATLGVTSDDTLAALAESLATQMNLQPTVFKLQPTDTIGDVLNSLAQRLNNSAGGAATREDGIAANWSADAEMKLAGITSSVLHPSSDLRVMPTYSRNVLLAGAKCPIGCALLEKLMTDDEIDKVTCLVTASTDDRAMADLLQHLDANGYDVPRFYAAGVELEVLAYDPKRPQLGLKQGDWMRLAGGVTDVVTAGWDSGVDDSLKAYEEYCIRRTCAKISLEAWQSFAYAIRYLLPSKQ